MALRAALFRGVNVGGRRGLPMAALRALAAELGLGAPQTLLQSGNLVFESEALAAELEALLEREIAARHGLVTDVFVRGSEELAAAIAANPLPDMAEDDPSHLLVFFLKRPPAPEEVAAVRAAVRGRERIEAAGRALYIAYPDGVGDSRLTSAVIERRLAQRCTARNWNTVLKLAAMLGPG